ncbi:MAG: hypothetical protein NZ740_10055 [Kiritimatiellae bacterium]|nr:hypothetical protein [Kiritimatiellia bacterium]MDW8459436.1 hypothetical protein [Verrucomicrobiota bacterium]
MPVIMPLAAGIGIEELIWLVILIIWGIAQTLQKAREGRRAPPRPPPASRPSPASPLDEELRELLEQLSGRPSPPTAEQRYEEVEVETEPAEPAPPPPRPAAPEFRPPPLVVTPPVMSFPVTAPAAPSYPSTLNLEGNQMTLSGVSTSQPDETSGRTLLRSALNAPGLSMRMKSLHFKGMSRLLSFNPSATRGPALVAARDLRNKRALRRAMLTKFILDPPRALNMLDRPV